MHAAYFSLFDMAICGIPVILFCIWQLISVNREIARDRRKPAPPPPSPQRPGHPIGQHRLNDG